MEYDFDRTGNSQAPFQVEGVIPVNADQTWTGPVLPDPRLEPGKVALRVRCVLTNQYGTSIYVYYSDRIEIDLTEETPTSV